MRQFVAGLCCAIVGLEVLVAVPLVTCLVMFALVEEGGMSPVAIEVHAESPPADLAALVQYPAMPPYPSSPPVTPVGIPALSFPQPTTCPPPSTVADSCPPLSPAIESIAESRQRNGSPLDGTIVALDLALPHSTADEFTATVQRLASEESSPLICHEQATDAGHPPVTRQLPDTLQSAAQELYVRAQELEIEGNFARADQIRQLARQIRSEIDSLRRETNPVAPTPSTVTEASFNPEPPANPYQTQSVNPIEPPAASEPAPLLEKDSANPAP